jgi:protein ImuA
VPRAEGLNALYDRIRRIEAPARHGVLPFDVAEIDRALPGGGLALGAVHEILGADGDEEDGAAAAGFIAGILARLGNRPVLWCLKRPDLYGPGLLAHGLDPARLVLVIAKRDDEILWAMEEGLRAPGLAAVVGEVGRLPMVAGRRLQLAAERSGITAFLLRRWRNAEEAMAERERPSAALTRWRVTALSSYPHPAPLARHAPSPAIPGSSPGREGLGWGLGQPRWRVELLRCRGGVPAQWVVEPGEVEVADATGHVSLSATLADRPAAPPRREADRIAPAEPFRRAG